jgi:hypothetical protein
MDTRRVTDWFDATPDCQVLALIGVIYFGEAAAALTLILGIAHLLPRCFWV